MTSKTIKGRDLVLHLAQHVEGSEEIDKHDNPLSTLFYIESQTLPIAEHPWYKNLVYYLRYQKCPNDLDTHQRRRLHIESSRYIILGDFLFRRYVNGILLRCVNNEEEHKLLQETHRSSDSVIHVGGHFSAKATAFKIIKKGYYWPSIFRDSYNFSRSCDKCQKFIGKEHLYAMPLQPFLPHFPFSKWGLDFIDPITPPSSTGQVFNLKTIDYFTKWTEVVPRKHSQDEQVISFLETNIFSRFGIPLEIITDNSSAFIFAKMTQFLAKLGVKHFTSSTYYPQGNGQAESTNNNLVRIIKRLIEDKPHQWHTLLTYALWENHTTTKVSTGWTPFQLVYGQESIFPTELELSSLQLMLQIEELNSSNDHQRINTLLALEEQRMFALENIKR
jgi:hypothetical protein